MLITPALVLPVKLPDSVTSHSKRFNKNSYLAYLKRILMVTGLSSVFFFYACVFLLDIGGRPHVEKAPVPSVLFAGLIG